jgi:hypothetical protein
MPHKNNFNTQGVTVNNGRVFKLPTAVDIIEQPSEDEEIDYSKGLKILFGKHKGSSVRYVFDNGPKYFQWLLSLPDLNEKLRNEMNKYTN